MFESSLTTLNCVYFALFFVGLGYAIFVAVTGGLSDIDMPNVDADIHIGGADIAAGGIDAPDVSVSPLSPITLATFVTVFGGVGVITTQLFNVGPGLSLVISVLSGLLSGGGMYLFYSQFLIRSQGSSEIHHGELIGLEAEVTVPIGENVTGQVTYLTRSGRMSSMARSTDGRPIPRGQLVEIVRTSGPQVLVRPVKVESEEEV
jgi:membrane protein implicated in regulation of membrane protease activity